MTCGSATRGNTAGPERDPIRAPRGVAVSLTLFATALVAVAIYLAAVRREALFVDLAGLSGLLFCF